MVAATASSRREELLDELVELFLREGFRQFKLTDLTDQLRCSKSTLYTLGESKEQLVGNAVRRFFARATAAVEARTANARCAGDRVAAYLTAVSVELSTASEAFMRDVTAHPVARDVYARNTSAAADRVRRLIREGVEDGTFRPVRADFVADTVAATMARIQSGEVMRHTGIADADAYEELACLVLDGVVG